MRREDLGKLHWLAALAATGCAGLESSIKGGDADSAQYDTGNVVDSGDEGEDTAQPTWWKLDAALQFLEGAVQLEGTTLTLTLLDEGGLALCSDDLPVTRVRDLDETPDEIVYTWTRLTHDDPQGDCALWPSPAPGQILLGVGELHPEIVAGLPLLGLDGYEDSLNAAYASLDGGTTVYVYAVAGTASAYAGETLAASAAPLSDGSWDIRAIYPFNY